MPKGLPEDRRSYYVSRGKILEIHAITPSNAHSPIKVLYLLKNGLWIIVLNLSSKFSSSNLHLSHGAKLHKNGDFYAE